MVICVPSAVWATPLFWGGIYILGVCVTLLALGIRSLKAKALAMPRWIRNSFVLFWIVPPVLMPLIAQPRLSWPVLVGWALGGPLVAAFLVIQQLAQRQIGRVPGLRTKSNLVTGGVYGVVRHPLYLGNLLFALGWALCWRGVHALVFVAVVALCYLLMIALEEGGLEEEYGDEYREYRQRVRSRLVPGLY